MATVKKRMSGHRVYRKRRFRLSQMKDKTKDKGQVNFSDLFEPSEEQQDEQEVQEAFNRAYAETLDDWEGDIEK